MIVTLKINDQFYNHWTGVALSRTKTKRAAGIDIIFPEPRKDMSRRSGGKQNLYLVKQNGKLVDQYENL